LPPGHLLLELNTVKGISFSEASDLICRRFGVAFEA
jgi:hypothetical protein